MSESFININGEIISAGIPVLKINNRAFCYGDALFETMRWHKKNVLFLHDHFERITKGMRFLKIELPENFSQDFFQKHIRALIKKNKINEDARIRLQVFRNDGGYYTPVDNSAGFVISAEKLVDENYSLNEKGLTVGIFHEIKKLKQPLSNLKTSNSVVYMLAGIFAKKNQLDDCFILNPDENIADAISSSVFMVKDKTVFTPPLPDGCVEGVMRKNIIKILNNNKILFEEKSISIKDILLADEIFLTNVIQGVQWVEKFRDKKYTDSLSKIIFEKLSLFVGQ